MAAPPGPDARDNYDMTQSVETWHTFLRLSKWLIILSVITLVGMALFLTGNPPN
jgi:hypothetical protein